MKLNYRRVRIIGRCVLGLFFAGVITFAIYKIGHSKTEVIIVFLPTLFCCSGRLAGRGRGGVSATKRSIAVGMKRLPAGIEHVQ